MTLTSRAISAMLKIGPALATEVVVERDVPVSAPDGVRLLTDVYLAASRRPLPVILVRSPYGRGSGAGGLAGRLFAERGYHAVVQSTRGTAGSGGRVDFDKEATDGRATADWIVEQDWCDGSIGTFGGSYLTFTQYALASTRPPQLKAMATAVWAAERRAPYFYGGSFALGRALGWPAAVENQDGGRGPSLLRALRARRALGPAFSHLPLLDADTIAYGHPVPYYRDWISHDQPGDPYWAPTDFRPVLAGLGVPVTMAAGWYDLFLPSMLADYRQLRAGGQRARLAIGAWHHSSRGLYQHSVQDALDWFGTHLLGRRPPRSRPCGSRLRAAGGATSTTGRPRPASSDGTCSRAAAWPRRRRRRGTRPVHL